MKSKAKWTPRGPTNTTVTFSCTKRLKTQIKQAALKEGRPVSNWVSRVLMSVLDEEEEPAEVKSPRGRSKAVLPKIRAGSATN